MASCVLVRSASYKLSQLFGVGLVQSQVFIKYCGH